MTSSRTLSAGVVLWLLGAGLPLAASAVGDKASSVEPSEWINGKGSTTWRSLKGRLILVEKWATWCPPCRESIAHLNQLHQEYSKKGLVIIGVSEEPVATIKSFMEKTEMKYLV